MSRLVDALGEIQDQRQPKRIVIPATLGNGDGSTVKYDGRPGYHWIRLYGDINQVVPALNRVTSATYNLQVEVAVSTDRSQGKATYEVLGIGLNEILTYSPTGDTVVFDPYMPEHGSTHSWSTSSRGRDAVNIYPRNIAVGRVYQTTPASMYCNVSPVEYLYGSSIKYYAGGQTGDFTSEVPATAGKAALAYVCIDGSTGGLAYLYSDEFDWTGYTDPVPSSARIDITVGYVLLSALILYEGMTTITEANFRYEMRPLFHAVGNAVQMNDDVVLATDSGGNLVQVLATGTGLEYVIATN